jgi:class 3 adenylate cyclase/tetratricopeptide (TPR) repeat protein
MKFCGNCGAPLANGSTLGETLSSSQVLADTETLPTPPGGELRFVSVLFADLVGSTAFAEDQAPDEVARIVGDLLQQLGIVVQEHSGAVDKFLGDAVMATFGLPRPDPNAARNAVRAGLAMQATIHELARTYGVNLQLRVGIHAGEVMFRALGTNWTVMGDTVNTASRIQTATTPGKVWISRSVYDKVRRHFAMVSRPAVELKGKRHAVQPYEVIAERATPFVERPLFVGREREWQEIQTLLREVIDTRTLRVLIIRGDAGVGKSRLVWELRDWIQRQEDIYRVDVVQYDHSERLPSHGLNALLRNRFNISLNSSDDQVLNRLREKLHANSSTANTGDADVKGSFLQVEFFAYMLGILRDEFKIRAMDGQSRWDGAFVELKTWLEARATQTPWLWILEDAQKGDATTAAFLDWLLRVQWKAPAFVLITVREEDFAETSAWYGMLTRHIASGTVHELRLREIATPELTRALLAMSEGLVNEATARRIAEHTEGNPLFATELLLFLYESQELNDDTVWEQHALPGTIREVMEARLERLGTEGKEVAKRGALMGRRFARQAIERIWDRPIAELDRGIEVLRETETIYEEASPFLPGEIEAVFRHSRLQEAAEARIPREERVRWLDGLAVWANGTLDRLGERWEAAGTMLLPLIVRARQARGDLQQASAWSELLGMLHLKYHRLNEAIQALSDAYKDAEGSRRIVLNIQVAQAQQFAGQAERALATLEGLSETQEQAPFTMPESVRCKLSLLQTEPWMQWGTFPISSARAMLKLMRAEVLTDLARTPDARQVYDAVERELAGSKDDTQFLWLRWGWTYCYFLVEVVGDPHTAMQVYQHARAQVDRTDPTLENERLRFLYAEGLLQARLGRFERAREIAQERMCLAEARHDLRAMRDAVNTLGLTHFAQGELALAEACWERTLEISRSIGYRRGEAISLHNLGLEYRDQAKWTRAIATEQEYWDLSRMIGNHAAEGYARVALGQLATDMGNYEHALELLNQARAAAEQNGWQRLQADADALVGLVDLYRWLDEHEPEELTRAVNALRASEEGWSYQDDTGEMFAMLIIAHALGGNRADAETVLQRARAATGDAWLLSKRWLDAAEAIVTGMPLVPVIEWFERAEFHRAVQFLQRLPVYAPAI